jgi:hypothetical protein
LQYTPFIFAQISPGIFSLEASRIQYYSQLLLR